MRLPREARALQSMTTNTHREIVQWPSAHRATPRPIGERWNWLKMLFQQWDRTEWLWWGVSLGAFALALALCP